VAIGAASAIISHCTVCSATSADGGCVSFFDCEFENSCQNCIILCSGAAAVVADCVLNCSLGYAVVAKNSSITLVRCSLMGVASVSSMAIAFSTTLCNMSARAYGPPFPTCHLSRPLYPLPVPRCTCAI
jgi:hypothetical protein